MADLKTKISQASVDDFLDGIKNDQKRSDCKEIARMIEKAIGCKPKMWGPSIVGYGEYHFKYESGREGDWMRVGFAPRAQNISLYIMDGFGKYDELMSQLGKHKTGKSCLYIKRLSDIDRDILRQLIEGSLKHFEEKYGPNES